MAHGKVSAGEFITFDASQGATKRSPKAAAPATATEITESVPSIRPARSGFADRYSDTYLVKVNGIPNCERIPSVRIVLSTIAYSPNTARPNNRAKTMFTTKVLP